MKGSGAEILEGKVSQPPHPKWVLGRGTISTDPTLKLLSFALENVHFSAFSVVYSPCTANEVMCSPRSLCLFVC